jgi:hypothetical protein
MQHRGFKLVAQRVLICIDYPLPLPDYPSPIPQLLFPISYS